MFLHFEVFSAWLQCNVFFYIWYWYAIFVCTVNVCDISHRWQQWTSPFEKGSSLIDRPWSTKLFFCSYSAYCTRPLLLMKLGLKHWRFLKKQLELLVSLTAIMGFLFVKTIEAAVLIHLLEAIFNKLAELWVIFND